MTWLPRSNRFLRLLMLAAVVLLATSITQCRMVTDRLVRVEAEDFGGANSCIKRCIKAANEAKEDEKELHKDKLEACGRGDDDDEDEDLTAGGTFRREAGKDKKDKKDNPDKDKIRKACIEAEDARHKAALKAIDARRTACMNGCHHQGGGSGR